MEQFTYFYKSHSPFSQWFPCSFTVGDNHFNSAEQYMMYCKARLFGDEERSRRILLARIPREQKELGRQVKGFEQSKWELHCKDIVYEGNKEKFIQNEELLQQLLDTQGTTLVEASPTDRIWGVGLTEDDPAIRSRSTWRGSNWLGEVLTTLREDLIKG
ncbi:GTP cyclohydrolase [Paenibacillus sp. FSL R7-0273]|uniref:NADAR family protein n=1 Tax=Paenibacillus sp. FSL R7-0273 TaxID=1536772 RepID=UPI0004F77AAB|nr:NADAR family protein [Paenibacillus sp. FSL R7-0273]AIQ47075.1 GTP cyclohydrolase [Paenibacillus sp. FSL R7-0273]OMF97170.1 GTP cyclohydrolase [Paenibacillus sp. FSL R7-0273]